MPVKGSVISQQRGNDWKPIAFYSKHLSVVEYRYSTSVRELLAIVLCVEKFKQFLYGRKFIIFTDHQPLKFLTTADSSATRLARLQNRLGLYEYNLENLKCIFDLKRNNAERPKINTFENNERRTLYMQWKR